MYDIPAGATDVKTVKEGDPSVVTYTLPADSPDLIGVFECPSSFKKPLRVESKQNSKPKQDNRRSVQLTPSAVISATGSFDNESSKDDSKRLSQRSHSAHFDRTSITKNDSNQVHSNTNETPVKKNTKENNLSPEAQRQLNSIIHVTKPVSNLASNSQSTQGSNQPKKLSQQAEAELESILALANQPRKKVQEKSDIKNLSRKAESEFDSILNLLGTAM